MQLDHKLIIDHDRKPQTEQDAHCVATPEVSQRLCYVAGCVVPFAQAGACKDHLRNGIIRNLDIVCVRK